MSSVVISGDTSGAITVKAPDVAGGNTITLAPQTGTLNVAGPAFFVKANASQTISSGVETKIQLNNELFDTNNNFDPTTNYRFTPTVEGYYQINAHYNAKWSTTFTGIYAAIYKNGAVYQYIPNNYTQANVNASVAGSVLVYMNGSTDYIELYGFASGTGTYTGGSSTSLSGSLVRGA